MSERWKHQIKIGIFWGLFMTVFNVLFELQEKPLNVQLTTPNLYIRLVVFTFFGIFLLGYFNWKGKQKKTPT